MTLIVAKIVKENVQILSDTQITDVSLERSTNPLQGKLKSIIVNPFTSISFSGNIGYAEGLLRFIYRNNISNIRAIIESALSANIHSDDNTHFIICYLHNNEPKLIVIRNRKVEDVKAAYIGDSIAYKKYREFYEFSAKSAEFDKMLSAFEMVVADESKETYTVGQFVTRIETESAANVPLNFLGYQVNQIKIIGKQEFIEKFKGNFFIRNANSNEGGYCFSFLRGFQPNNPAYAIHFHVGGYGILFYPAIDYGQKEHCTPTIIYEPDGTKFAYAIKERYNLEIQGLVVAGNGFGYQLINTAV